MSKLYKIFLPILLVTTFLYLPLLSNPKLFLNRGNDLEEFFWPIYFFTKNQIITNRTFPLWYPHILSGTPLLPDPQAPLFYPPNIIFLLLPINAGFLVSSFIHTFIGGVGAYLAAKKGFNFSKSASFLTAFLYITSPRLAAFLEAGHFGLVMSWAWIPFIVLSVIKIIKKPTINWSVVLAVAISGLFFTHTVTFLIFSVMSFLVISSWVVIYKPKKWRSSILYFITAAILSFGLVSIAFLPQLSWKNLTTRQLLIEKPQIFPVWESKGEFLKTIFVPFLIKDGIRSINTEKYIFLGIFPSLIAIFGFLKLPKKMKKLTLVIGLILVLLALSNASPIYKLLLNQKWYVIMRVPTRVWVIAITLLVFLAGFGYSKFSKEGLRGRLIKSVAILAVVESLIFSWLYFTKPIKTRQTVPPNIITQIKNDKSDYRVLCLTRCISPKIAVKQDLKLVDGYGTLIQTNYNQQAWSLTGGYWDYYALPLPPTGVYKYQDLQPDPISLAQYNTKYIISDHQLTDDRFELLKKEEKHVLYKNSLIESQPTTPIDYISPNHLRINTKNLNQKSVVLSEVFSPGWRAYLNGTQEVAINETPIALRAIEVRNDTDFIDVVYKPKSYEIGKIITFSTVALIFIWYMYSLILRPR